MSVNEEGSMHIHPLLALPLLISVGAASVAAQSSSVKNPSLSAPPQSAPSSIRIDRLQLPFQGDRNDLSKTVPGTIGGGEHSTIIPPLPLYAIAPLEVGAFDPTLGQGDVCYSIRGYRVTRDDPESDSTRPAGYSTCQPAARFHVKNAGDLRAIAPR
jgi:hypothetical protein